MPKANPGFYLRYLMNQVSWYTNTNVFLPCLKQAQASD